MEPNTTQEQINWKDRQRVFGLFVAMNLLLNFDTGVIPASLMQIEEEVEMTYQEKAALGSLVYLGLCTASLIVPTVFHYFSAGKALGLMIAVNCCFCTMFSFSSNIYLMYVARFGMGFSQAFPVIYGPVWANQFSPPHKATRWMGILQSAVPSGIVLGYAVAGTFIYFCNEWYTWRLAIQFQALLEIPIVIGLFCSRSENLDINDASLSKESMSLSSLPAQLRMVTGNGLFVLITLSLCSLYFVVTGIQYWMTVYMVTVLGADPMDVIVAFVFICATAPLAGVLIGSYITDYIGGYKGENLNKAVMLCVVFGALSSLCATPLMIVDSLQLAGPLTWLLLFFGGCLIPTATGITVNSLPKEYQSSASSISQLVFNLGGYFMAPVLSAAIMDAFTEKEEGLTWGFRSVLMVSFIGILFLISAWYATLKREKYALAEDSVIIFEFEEMKREIIRRVGRPY